MTVVWSPSSLRDLRRLDRPTTERVLAAVQRFADEGHGDIKKLQGTEEYRLRVGTVRVRFRRGPVTTSIEILRVLRRDKAYR